MAAGGSRKRPPSLKESGVMLTTPMTRVRLPSERVRVRRRHWVMGRIAGGFQWSVIRLVRPRFFWFRR